MTDEAAFHIGLLERQLADRTAEVETLRGQLLCAQQRIALYESATSLPARLQELSTNINWVTFHAHQLSHEMQQLWKMSEKEKHQS